MKNKHIEMRNQTEAVLWTALLVSVGQASYVFEPKINYLPELYWGFVIALVLFFIQDYFRRPKLRTSVGDFNDQKDGYFRILHVNVINLDWPWWFFIFRRNKAINTTVTIEIRSFSESTLIKSYDGRWSVNPEPIKKDSNGDMLFDEDKAKEGKYIDLSPSLNLNELREGKMAVVVKFKGENDCYGFSDYSYREGLKPEKWKLERGMYKVTLIIKVDRQTFVSEFKLHNKGTELNDIILEQNC